MVAHSRTFGRMVLYEERERVLSVSSSRLGTQDMAIESRQANVDNALYTTLMDLKRHIARCPSCRLYEKTDDPVLLCKQGIRLVVTAAKQYDKIPSIRIRLRNSKEPYVYPCPSIRAHGKTYELSAIPVIVVGHQDRLT